MQSSVVDMNLNYGFLFFLTTLMIYAHIMHRAQAHKRKLYSSDMLKRRTRKKKKKTDVLKRFWKV